MYLTVCLILMPLPEDGILDLERFLSKSKYKILSKCKILGLLMSNIYISTSRNCNVLCVFFKKMRAHFICTMYLYVFPYLFSRTKIFFFKISDYVRFYFYVLNTASVEQRLKACCRIYGMSFSTRPRRGIQRNVCTEEGPVTVASLLQSD